MAEPLAFSRREFFVVGAAAVAGSIACRTSVPAPPPISSNELLEIGAADAVAAMKRGDITAERYAAALLERCEAGKRLNAFITLDPARVEAAAREADRRRASRETLGPLHGLPIPIKDSVNTKELPTTAGTPGLRTFRPMEDAPVVRALVQAGGIVLGKTNLHELSLGWTSSNQAFGPVRNPYDPTRIPGGSSGGTAAAIAARMAPLGVAEDTEGSIRVPAALCGIAGFRPTTGRYPSAGVAPITPLFDQVGPHARSVADLVLFDQVVAREAGPIAPLALKGIRLGVSRGYYFEDLDPNVERIVAEALKKLTEAGVEFVEAEVPDLARMISLTTAQIQVHDLIPTLSQYLTDFGAGVDFAQVRTAASPDIRQIIDRFDQTGRKWAEKDYPAARDVHLPRLKKTFREYFISNGLAAIILPATRIPAVPIGATDTVEISGKTVPFSAAISRNIAPGSTTGLPGLVLPAGLTGDGLPVSLEVDGPAGTDRTLLALGLSLERVLGRLPAPRPPAA
jgi:Asp-tRNA(Asn)/Glu-tRNA(Gln) amidotransferase A subunit family amidase